VAKRLGVNHHYFRRCATPLCQKDDRITAVISFWERDAGGARCGERVQVQTLLYYPALLVAAPAASSTDNPIGFRGRNIARLGENDASNGGFESSLAFTPRELAVIPMLAIRSKMGRPTSTILYKRNLFAHGCPTALRQPQSPLPALRLNRCPTCSIPLARPSHQDTPFPIHL
jgi:hypothetical protein